MLSDRQPDDHRKFLKHYFNDYKLGFYFPKQLSLLPKSDLTDFHWLSSTRHGAVVFMMSANCSACNIGPVQEFVRQFESFEYCLLFEGSEEAMEQQRDFYEIDYPLYRCDTVKLENQLHVSIVPFALILNPLGQIVGAGIFNDIQKLKMLAAPLIRVYERHLLAK